jgi:8-oxo-dGTP pyrophosphatase MutT (NUDIX family)
MHCPGAPAADVRLGALFSGELPAEAWSAGQPTRVDPATDERPFFFDLHRAQPLLPLLTGAAALVVVALLLARDRAASPTPLAPRGWLVAGLTGAGFLMAQSGLLARAQFLIGYPALAAAAVIGGMLTAAGLASLVLGGRGAAATRLRTGGLIVAAAATASVLLWPLTREASRGLDSAGLVAVATLLAALVGAPAGLAFPAGLQLFGRGETAAVFYGANAVAAVIGGSAASLLAPAFGLSALLAGAALLYAVAAALAGGPGGRVDAVAPGLRRHLPADPREGADLAKILGFIDRHAAPFDRKIPEGHLTGAALIVSAGGERVLLLHHRKLDRWLQPGGHGDAGETCGEAVALREALEETGIAGLALHPGAPRPLDVDVHPIPARGAEPAHEHLDLRYLVVAPAGAEARLNADESHAIRWFGWDELDALGLDPGLVRALGKVRRIVGR